MIFRESPILKNSRYICSIVYPNAKENPFEFCGIINYYGKRSYLFVNSQNKQIYFKSRECGMVYSILNLLVPDAKKIGKELTEQIAENACGVILIESGRIDILKNKKGALVNRDGVLTMVPISIREV